MASQIYITYTDENNEQHFYELTCSTSVSVSHQNNVTTQVVESGANISDHVHNNPVKISFSGLITEIQNYKLDYFLPPSELIQSLINLRRTKTPFTVNISEDLEVYQNCVFNSFDINKGAGQGTSWQASLNIQQIDLSEVASLSEFPEQSETVSKQHGGKGQQGDGGTEQTQQRSLLYQIRRFAFNTLGEIVDAGSNIPTGLEEGSE